MKIPFNFYLLLLYFISYNLSAQNIIKGKITDSDTGEGMPFVNVYFNKTTIGTTTDFDGYFNLPIPNTIQSDSLVASYIGYTQKVKYFEANKSQVINFQLKPDAQTLQEVQVVYGEYENPAWEVLRSIIDQKKKNDKRSLDAYEYESYTKIEIDVDNISEKFRKKKVVQKIIAVLDSIERIAGEDGNPILPVFISESLSDYYFLKEANRKKEVIKKTKVTGIGVSDGSTVSQIIGSSFQEYNFYKNWLNIVEKDFVSPIADSWKLFYEYELEDENAIISQLPTYRIKFTPKRPQDLAFSGTMWIDKQSYAIKQIDVTVGQSANLNFVEKIKIQQEYANVEKGGAWLPNKTRVLIDIGEIRDDWAGMLAKFYVSNKDFVVNKPRDPKFFDEKLKLAEDALINNTPEYWNKYRHDSLTASEKNVYLMIDTVKNLPVVKTYVELANIVINGYKKAGKFDIGPYSYAYAFNDIEGHRFRIGFRTNYDFSKKFIFKGYGAYGLRDEQWKYLLEGQFLISRKPWTKLGISRSVELEQVGIYNDDLNNTVLFNAFSRFGTLRRPFTNYLNKVWFQTEILPGLRQGITFKNRRFDPLYNFQFFLPQNDVLRKQSFTVSELSFELRYSPGERFIQNDNSRISLGNGSRPTLLLKYTYGIDNLMGSNFNYHKYFLGVNQTFRLGTLGRSRYELTAGYTPSTIPYPLLESHLGNESSFYNDNSYNLMNFFEFVSDTYTSLKLRHQFDGLIMNRIPLFKKLKWRLFTTANILYGSVRQENIEIIPTQDEFGNVVAGFNALGDHPYTEVGYGVENIFKFIRVDFIHRLNYLNKDTNSFGVRFSAQFKL